MGLMHLPRNMPRGIKNKPIGIFDSGIGGLTVVKEVIRYLPGESIIYFGDTARVPYGTKSQSTITKFAIQDVNFLLKRGVKAVIAACFTVSSNAMDILDSKFDIPILGMVEPGVSAIKKTGTKFIGIIGTQATIESKSYERRLKKEIKGVRAMSRACPLFVPLAEEGWVNNDVAKMTVERYLLPLKKKGIEALVLACTHYPLLKKAISEFMGKDVKIILPGQELAFSLKKRLAELNLGSSNKDKGELKVYLSDIPRNFERIAKKFLGVPVLNAKKVEIENKWEVKNR